MNAEEFFAKAKGTILEDEIGILFNLYCVYTKIRPAYLYFKKQVEVIKKLFPFFKITYGKYKAPYSEEIDNNAVIIHIEDLPFFDEKIISPYTIWIGKALGYSCPGQMGGLNPIMHSFKFSIMTEDNKTKGIYGEVCWDEKNYDYSKIKKMKSVATELNYRFFLINQKNIGLINYTQ